MAARPQRWFDITCSHGYFSDGICRKLQLTPTPACERLLRRYRLRFQSQPGGAALYFDQDDRLALLQRFDETEPFTFAMHSSEPRLLSLTGGVPAAGAGAASGVYYFDNLAGAGGDLLHPAGASFGGGRLAVRPRRFVHADAPPGLPMTVRARGGVVVWESGGAAGQGGQVGRVDLSGMPDGCYTLACGDAAHDFYLSEEIAPARQFGVAAVYAAPVHGDALYPLDAECNPVARSYRIAFETLHCHWCYVVMARSPGDAAPAASVTVIDRRRGDVTPVSFAEPEGGGTVKVDGRAATLLVSNQPLPLLEVPDAGLGFYLHRADGTAQHGAGVALPYARPESLVHAPQGSFPMRADIHVPG